MRRWNRTLGVALGLLSLGAEARAAHAAQSDAPASTDDDGYLWHAPEQPAVAPGPSSLQPGWQVSAFAGYGYNPFRGNEASPGTGEWRNPLGFGVGLRGRYQLSVGLSLGLRFSHHWGASDDGAPLSVGLIEAGWALPLGPLRGELFVGAGLAYNGTESELCMIGGECTTVDLGGYGTTLELGLTLAYPFAERYFVAATGESLLLPDGLGILGHVGAGLTF